jgi:hypothetical protein
MRTTERIFGVLASVLGLVALVLSLTQRIVQVSTSSFVIYGPGIDASNRLAIFLPLALTVLGVALACLSALLDAHRPPQRGTWLAVLLVGVVMGFVGVWLLSANGVWLDLGTTSGSLAPATSQVSIAALYFPAALAGAVAVLLALVRRGPRVTPA